MVILAFNWGLAALIAVAAVGLAVLGGVIAKGVKDAAGRKCKRAKNDFENDPENASIKWGGIDSFEEWKKDNPVAVDNCDEC